MIYVQVITEYEVDEELLIEDFRSEWESDGGGDMVDFIDYLLANGIVDQASLGTPGYQHVSLV